MVAATNSESACVWASLALPVQPAPDVLAEFRTHSYYVTTDGRVQATATLCFRPYGAVKLENSLGQCGPDCLKFLWLTADLAIQTQYGFSLDGINNNFLDKHIIDSQQAMDYLLVRGGKYHENLLRLLTCIFVLTCIFDSKF